MNFFTQLTALMQPGITLNLTAVAKDGTLTVGVLPSSKDNNIPMLTLTGTPEEIDEAFFAQIQAPIERASGLITNTEDFNKKLDEEEKDAAEEKELEKKVSQPVKKSDKKKEKKKSAPKPETPNEEVVEGPKEQSLFS